MYPESPKAMVEEATEKAERVKRKSDVGDTSGHLVTATLCAVLALVSWYIVVEKPRVIFSQCRTTYVIHDMYRLLSVSRVELPSARCFPPERVQARQIVVANTFFMLTYGKTCMYGGMWCSGIWRSNFSFSTGRLEDQLFLAHR